MVQQREHEIRNLGRGGLVPGDQNADAQVHQLDFGQPVVDIPGIDQRRHQIVPRSAPVILDQLTHICAEFFHIGVEFRRGQGTCRQGGIAPHPEPRPVLGRYAEHPADHRNGDRQRVAVHEIGGRPGRLQLVEQLMRQLLDLRPELFDLADGERLGHQRPQPGVIGRVHAQDAAVPAPFGLPRLVVPCALGTAEALIAEDEPGFGIPGHEPGRLRRTSSGPSAAPDGFGPVRTLRKAQGSRER